MYWTLRKSDGREIKTYSKFRVLYLRLLGWKLTCRFEGSE